MDWLMKLFNNITYNQLSFMLQFMCFWFIGIFLSILTHELSHYIAAKLAGWKVTRFAPYPHKQKDGWVAGAIYYKHNDKNMHYMPYMLSAPLYKAYLMFSLWSILGFLYFPLWALAISELVDYLEWWFGYIFRRDKSDGFRLWYLTALQGKKK